MNHTAQDLFTSWYNKGVNKEAGSEELNIRRNAIQAILAIKDRQFWIKMLKVYLGISKFDSSDYNQVLEHVKKGDENFSIQNENVVRLISGCAIAQKIDINDSYICDFLALALMTSNFSASTQRVLTEVLDRARLYWAQECEEKRSLDVDFEVGSSESKSSITMDIPQLTGDGANDATHSAAVLNVLTDLQKELNTSFELTNKVNKSLEAIKSNFIALSEETNILWWLFGSYSSIVQKPFIKLHATTLSIITSFEISELTKALPGIGGFESIIHRALSTVSFDPATNYSLEAIISSIKEHEEPIKRLIPSDLTEIHFCTPLLSALKYYFDLADTEWKKVFQKYVGVNADVEFTLVQFSSQLYKELMLTKVYKRITS
jgi:hypothetical protein